MCNDLTAAQLLDLVQRVFAPTKNDKALAILMDLPDDVVRDNQAWAERRKMAADWTEKLVSQQDTLGLDVNLVLYANTHMNNADLPELAWIFSGGDIPLSVDDLDRERGIAFDEIFSSHGILLAPTEFSTTAPLKLAATRTGIRAATMPGFCPSMIPALRLDYDEINRRVEYMTSLLSRADKADFIFRVDESEEYKLTLDLRHRTAHASGGLFHEPGQAGNLPSGESYIVPYEGELDGHESGSHGLLPVELDGEVVLYSIHANRATEVISQGRVSSLEAEKITAEPAYGNLAELGIGVLGDFDLEPTGEILLDEKLGLHIAFGRSDHFGGQVGTAQFSSPDAVVHIDRVYVPGIQPRVVPVWVELSMDNGDTIHLMDEGKFVVEYPDS